MNINILHLIIKNNIQNIHMNILINKIIKHNLNMIKFNKWINKILLNINNKSVIINFKQIK